MSKEGLIEQLSGQIEDSNRALSSDEIHAPSRDRMYMETMLENQMAIMKTLRFLLGEIDDE